MTTGTYQSGGGTHAFPSIAFTADGTFHHTFGPVFSEFVINNPHAGATQFYSIHLFSNDGEGGDFNFSEDGTPTSVGGHITSVEIRDASNHPYATFVGTFNDALLFDFWNILQSPSGGPKAALDNLIGTASVTGSADADQVETYGADGHYSLGDGNDTLDIFHDNTHAAGEGGNDTFVIEKGGLVGLDIHGGLADGTVAPGEVNTIDFGVGGTLGFAKIDGFTSFQFTGLGDVDGAPFDQSIYLNTDQLPGGTTPVFNVTGSDAHHVNRFVIEPFGAGAQLVNLSNVTTTNFTRPDQVFLFDFGGDTSNDTAFGVPNAHNVFQFGSGNDLAVGGSLADVFIGGPGNDTFEVMQSGFFSGQLHGGLADGTVAPGEVNTLDFHVAGRLSFATIDGFNSVQFTGLGDIDSVQFNQFIYLNSDQLPGGRTPVFQVTGSDTHHGNEIVIEPSPGGGPERIDLRHVTVSNFARPDQAFWIDFPHDRFNDTAFGAPNARNVFHFGSGNDRAIGGNLDDLFIAGPGHDYFNGRGGIDVARYHGRIGRYTITKLGAHTYLVHDNGLGSPDGTDVLVNVEYLKFTNATVSIGGPVAVVTHTISALHTHDLAATSAHHFDLFA